MSAPFVTSPKTSALAVNSTATIMPNSILFMEKFYDIVPAMSRETMQYDVVIVGAGPSGLSTAIKLRYRYLVLQIMV